MPEMYELETVNYLNVNEIKSVLARVNQSYADTCLLGKGDSHSLFFKHLSKNEILAFPKIRGIKDVTLLGRLSTDPFPWVKLEQVFKSVDEQVSRFGACCISIDYEEKNSKQSSCGYDSVGIHLDQGKYFLSYRGNGSKVCTDREYGKTILKELINRLCLAITLEEGEGYYKLISSQGELKILRGGLFGKNPSAFQYELNEDNPEEIVAMLQSAYKLLSNGKVFDCSWRCFSRFAEDNPYVEDLFRFFDLLRQQDLPADSYDLDLELQVENLTDLDGLQRLCREQDIMFTRLISFDIDDDDYGELIVKTTGEGHRLQLEIKNPGNAEKVVQTLNIAFQALIE
jgi:hypothetical protein